MPDTSCIAVILLSDVLIAEEFCACVILIAFAISAKTSSAFVLPAMLTETIDDFLVALLADSALSNLRNSLFGSISPVSFKSTMP